MNRKMCSLIIAVLALSIVSGCSDSTSVQEGVEMVSSTEATSSVTEITAQTTAESTAESTTESTIESTLEEESSLVIPDKYYTVIDSIVDYIDKRKAGKKVSKAKAEELYGIDEICMVDNSLDILYYAFLDLDGDNIAELAVVERYDEMTTPIIRELYTFYDDSVHHVVCGWARNRYYILDDMGIYNEGSNGAAYSMAAKYKFDSNSHKLVFIDAYYTLDGNELKGKYKNKLVYCYTTKKSFVWSEKIKSSSVKVLDDLDENIDFYSLYNIDESDYYEYDNLISFNEYCDTRSRDQAE